MGILRSLVRRTRCIILRTIALVMGSPNYQRPGAVLVVAPHPDDETFGLGGLVASWTSSGQQVEFVCEVHVLFLTSGGKSHSSCCSIPPKDLESRREVTARTATALLGVRDENLHFFSLRDGELPHPGKPGFTDVTNRIAKLIEEVRADAVYAPHPLEGWSDHVAAECLARTAIQVVSDGASGMVKRLSLRPRLFHYCVWLWFSMPLRNVWKIAWRTAVTFNGSSVDFPDSKDGIRKSAHQAKLNAMRIYLEDICPCGRPSCGVLPEDLLDALEWKRELFFEVRVMADSRRRREQ